MVVFNMARRPRPPLFPCTTLFRSIPADHVLQLPASRNESMTFRLPVLQQDGQLDIQAAAGEVQAVWVTRAPEVRSGSRVNPLTEDRDNQTASFALDAGVEYLLSLRDTQAERRELPRDFGEALPARDVPDQIGRASCGEGV